MAYNSDGYIMIDFTEVDFRRTNQTIEGLFKRCVDVIGTNKFILVINANGRTPLPATCSFTNNQYVIDTVIYMFAVSSNDNLFIRRNDVPASDIIDDSSISVDKTWSSNKIDTELDTKADISALTDYQPLLTPGDGIAINDNIISNTLIKKFTYTGTGSYSNNTIIFPEKPKLILHIWGIDSSTGNEYSTGHIFSPDEYSINIDQMRSNGIGGNLSFITKIDDYTIKLNNITGQPTWNLNILDVVYTVYYI